MSAKETWIQTVTARSRLRRAIVSKNTQLVSKFGSTALGESMGVIMKKKRIVKPSPRRVQDSNIAVGERVRARRNQFNMSREILGQALEVSFQQIQKYERSANRISSGRLLQLAHALQCVTDLIGDGAKGSAAIQPFLRKPVPETYNS